MWTACVLTILPDMFPGPLGASLAGQGLADGRWRLDTINIRDFAADKHRSVDDTPAGGGPGMVMRADILGGGPDVPTVPSHHLALAPTANPYMPMTVRGKGILVCR